MTLAGAQCELVAGELLVAKARSDRSLTVHVELVVRYFSVPADCTFSLSEILIGSIVSVISLLLFQTFYFCFIFLDSIFLPFYGMNVIL